MHGLCIMGGKYAILVAALQFTMIRGGCKYTPDANGHVDIPDSDTKIKDNAFLECTSLKTVSIPNSVASIGKRAFGDCKELVSVNIPNSVTSIGKRAFENAALVSVNIPNSVTSMGNSTFRGTPLKSVKLSENLTIIASETFSGCTSLETVIIPDSVTKILSRAFYECTSLETVTFGNRITEFGFEAFRDCKKLVVNIPNGVQIIGQYAFRGTAILSVVIPDSVVRLNVGAFRSCQHLVSVKIGTGLKTIGPEAFYYCPVLRYIDFGPTVRVIEAEAFKGCFDMRSLYLPPNVFTIGFAAFAANIKLKYVQIGRPSVQSKTWGLLDKSVFTGCIALENVTFYSDEIHLHSSIFDECVSLKNLAFAKSMIRLTGLPLKFEPAYGDDGFFYPEAKWGCGKGYENLLNPSSLLFSCTACQHGYSSSVPANLGLCKQCTPGRYASTEAVDVCEQCEAGTYDTQYGSTSSQFCKPCPPRQYAPSTGSSQCLKCPAGSECPSNGTAVYTRCAPGRYNSFEAKTECLLCPKGKYGQTSGAAICIDCPQGTYLHSSGAVTMEACNKCSAGSYSSSNGSSLCSQCPKGHYQDKEGQSECIECKDEGNKLMTNAPDFKSCVVQQVLQRQSLSMVEWLFGDGNVAWYVSFSVSAIFVALCGIVQYMRMRSESDKEKAQAGREEGERHEKLAQLSVFQVLVKAGLPGLSFGSELVLMIGIYSENPPLAIVMLVFRLVHIVCTLFLMIVLFGSKSTRGRLAGSGYQVLESAASWHEHFNYDFAKERIPVVGVTLILCACDICLVQLLPWKETAFHDESKGFPAKSLMRFALGADMLQAFVSALCSIIFMANVSASDAKDPATSWRAKVFFGLNITGSLLTVIMSFVLLYLKERLLKMTATRKDEAAPLPAAAAGGCEVGKGGKRGSVELELSVVYNDESASDTFSSLSNPMHSSTSTTFSSLQEENIRLKDEVAALCEKNERLSEKLSLALVIISDLKAQPRARDEPSRALDEQAKERTQTEENALG